MRKKIGEMGINGKSLKMRDKKSEKADREGYN